MTGVQTCALPICHEHVGVGFAHDIGRAVIEQQHRLGIHKLSLESLSKRLGNLKGRGVLLKDGQSLKDLYEERVPLYEKYADITIDEEGKDLDESLRAILEIIHIKEQGK